MALPGKPRANRRSSSSSSYSSTITTVGFVALCVFGVWMLTSDSVVPSQSTTLATDDDFTTATVVDKAADLAIKSTDQNPNFDDNKPKEEQNPDPEPDPQDSGGDSGDTNAAQNQEENKPVQIETRVTDQETTMPQNVDTNTNTATATTSTDTNAESESKEESQEAGNQNQDQLEQSNQNQETNPTKEATETGENSNSNPNESTDQSMDLEQQRQQQQKLEAEQQQQQRERAEESEEVKVDQKIEESETQMAREEQLKQQAERQNMISEEDQQKRIQQQQQQQQQQRTDQNSEQKLNEQDKTNNPETKNSVDQADNSKSQQLDNQAKNNSNQEPKQKATSQDEANSGESFTGEDNSGIPKESIESKKAWSTQADQSENQKERHASKGKEAMYGYTWQLCNETAGPDFIPCLDNEKALRLLHSRGHFEHRERHCPEDPPTCLVPLPEGYKTPITWPQSRDKIWYHNVPHTSLAEFKGHQNWVKISGEFLIFPGGGTQFIHGATHYIDFIQKAVPDIAWGKHTRVVLDVGCGVASFGGYLFDKDVLTMSFAPKDEHEAQVQFALERGIPAISAVMGTQRLPFPSRVFDLVHCARCRVPWHAEGGRLLLELNRVLRPGGYFVWSATPVYQKKPEDVQIWQAMSALTISMCWELVTIKKHKINLIAAAIYRKPRTNDCYEQRKHKNPQMCKSDDDPNAAWYVPLQTCMHRVPVDNNERGTQWPVEWPARLQTPPYWLNSSQMGIYGKPAPQDFSRDYEHWKRVVERSYLKGLGIDWSNVRNVMDMRAVYGGFAAALKDMKVWVFNVVNTDSADTLPIIYERGLLGIYHDWCESFSSYPRTYDLLHADHLFSRVRKRCKLPPLVVEIDRLLRPGGTLIVRDESNAIGEAENLLKSLHWEVHLIFSKNEEGLLSAQKTDWRPDSYATSS